MIGERQRAGDGGLRRVFRVLISDKLISDKREAAGGRRGAPAPAAPEAKAARGRGATGAAANVRTQEAVAAVVSDSATAWSVSDSDMAWSSPWLAAAPPSVLAAAAVGSSTSTTTASTTTSEASQPRPFTEAIAAAPLGARSRGRRL